MALHTTRVFIELGCAIIGLAILARLANRWGFSAIPLYLLSGLAFGNGGLAPLAFSKEFVSTGAEIGVLLLLFMLGLEYTGDQLKQNLKGGLPSGIVDLVLNFTPGLIAGLMLGWKLLPSILLGGATYVSSSGIIARVLIDLGRLAYPETALVLSILVLEDLFMAVYLPVVGVLLSGGGPEMIALSIVGAIGVAAVALIVALKYGQPLSHFFSHESDEVILLTVLGTILLVAGTAQSFRVSAAVGAFLVGVAVSGPIEEQSRRLFAPLRDLFAATFFFFFGLEINPAQLPSAIPFAVALAVITGLTKFLTGYWAARSASADRKVRWRAGAALVARGEFSIVIAGLGAGIEEQLGPIAAAYVLILAIAGPLLMRVTK